MTSRKKSTTKSKKFDYKHYRKILKESGFVDWDLRKNPTDYQKRVISRMVRGKDSEIWRLAKNRHDSHIKSRFIKTAHKYDFKNISFNGAITYEQVAAAYRHMIMLHDDGVISEKEMKLLRNQYNALKSGVSSPNSNFGRMNFVKKKVSKKEGEILKREGYKVVKGYAFMPTNNDKTKAFLGVGYYEFPNGVKVQAVIEHLKGKGHEYRYFLTGSGTDIISLLEQLQNDGVDSLYPDLMYSSPSRTKNAVNQLVPSISDFLNYVNNGVMGKDENKNLSFKEKAEVTNYVIGGLTILSNKKPRKG